MYYTTQKTIQISEKLLKNQNDLFYKYYSLQFEM